VAFVESATGGFTSGIVFSFTGLLQSDTVRPLRPTAPYCSIYHNLGQLLTALQNFYRSESDKLFWNTMTPISLPRHESSYQASHTITQFELLEISWACSMFISHPSLQPSRPHPEEAAAALASHI
jgi:hypothetical protein